MANELELQLIAALQEIGVDVKQLRIDGGDNTTLQTNATTSRTAAINEVLALVQASGVGDMLNANNLSGLADVAVARTNLDVQSVAEGAAAITAAVNAITIGSLNGLSSAEITNEINNALASASLSNGTLMTEVDALISTAVQSITGMNASTLQTIQDITTHLAEDDSAFSALESTVSTKVSYTTPQPSITPEQRQIACENIGVGNPNADFLGAYTSARDA